MKNIFAAAVLTFASVIGAIPAAFAEPIVLPGSTYSLFIAGTDSGNGTNFTAIFDNTAETFSRAGLDITISESDTDLGGGLNAIALTLRANGNLFPSPNDASQYALGIFNDGLDFQRAATLQSASLVLYDLDGFELTTIDLGVIAGTPDPWDGIYPSPFNVFELGTQGFPISGFSFQFTVSSETITPPPAGVPEPGSLMLFAAGVAACALWRRRQFA